MNKFLALIVAVVLAGAFIAAITLALVETPQNLAAGTHFADNPGVSGGVLAVRIDTHETIQINWATVEIQMLMGGPSIGPGECGVQMWIQHLMAPIMGPTVLDFNLGVVDFIPGETRMIQLTSIGNVHIPSGTYQFVLMIGCDWVIKVIDLWWLHSDSNTGTSGVVDPGSFEDFDDDGFLQDNIDFPDTLNNLRFDGDVISGHYTEEDSYLVDSYDYDHDDGGEGGWIAGSIGAILLVMAIALLILGSKVSSPVSIIGFFLLVIAIALLAWASYPLLAGLAIKGKRQRKEVKS